MPRTPRLPAPPNDDPAQLLARWGADIDPELLELALTHRSYAYEAGGIPHNERLEFLGDAVLSIVVADRLFRDHPDLPESDLSRMRAATVSQEPLAMVARSIGLGDFIRLGRGEGLTGGRDKDSILSDTVEALIGATYLSHGLEAARSVVLRRLARLLDHAVERGQTQDWKTILVEYAHAQGLEEPVYAVEGEGPDHERVFTARVSFGEGEPAGRATETSKKHAENMAARDAMKRLDPQWLPS
ncbi:MAG: ribonuclease III [Actinomyces sp.]|jgi:ribonuclease-3|nr:ribonuclease III [Actinomyces sp.]MCI1641304.1 ribonuclease III [Actinomyces sp.]MCI1662123.1 ribonuclease III [Actinomyces sp.]MCI1690894.1 ribonuclease III [Actinomyces sp.]MCI1786925.1 ribonuclease III [Actinomyces sp.]MCI1828933.1 ribonuclease III [Actinomyces sp.]